MRNAVIHVDGLHFSLHTSSLPIHIRKINLLWYCLLKIDASEQVKFLIFRYIPSILCAIQFEKNNTLKA